MRSILFKHSSFLYRVGIIIAHLKMMKSELTGFTWAVQDHTAMKWQRQD